MAECQYSLRREFDWPSCPVALSSAVPLTGPSRRGGWDLAGNREAGSTWLFLGGTFLCKPGQHVVRGSAATRSNHHQTPLFPGDRTQRMSHRRREKPQDRLMRHPLRSWQIRRTTTRQTAIRRSWPASTWRRTRQSGRVMSEPSQQVRTSRSSCTPIGAARVHSIKHNPSKRPTYSSAQRESNNPDSAHSAAGHGQ